MSASRLWAYNSHSTSKVTMVITHAPWYKPQLSPHPPNIDEDYKDILFTVNNIGELKHKTFNKAVLHKSACYHDKKSTITLNLHTNDGSLFSVPPSIISCELSSAGDNQAMSCINENQLGGYNISFIPHNCGKYWLKVKL